MTRRIKYDLRHGAPAPHDELWHRLLELAPGAVSESGRLFHREGGHVQGSRRRRAFMLNTLLNLKTAKALGLTILPSMLLWGTK